MLLAKVKNTLGRGGTLSIAVVYTALLLTGAVVMLQPKEADAATLSSRSLTISSSANGTVSTATPGDGGNGQKAKYTFAFTLPASGTVGSVLFQFCTSPLPGTTCTAPTGFSATNVSSVTATGTGFASPAFTVDTATSITGCTARTNCIAIKHTATTASGAVTAAFGGGASDYITNPSADNSTFFARITTYSDNTFTTAVDGGSVAASTASQIAITAKVQETLNFSVGATYGAPNASCDPLANAGVALGDSNGVLSFNSAYDAHSYFRVSTNGTVGTKVKYSGDTLKSGSNSIAAIGGTFDQSKVGNAQFGIGLDSSDTGKYSMSTLVGTTNYAAGAGSITNLGVAKFAYDTSSVTTPIDIATASAPITCDTGSVRYLGNVATTTPSGVYTTTVTYIATPTY